MKTNCHYCKKEFEKIANNQKFCSYECWRNSITKFKKVGKTIKCRVCGKTLIKTSRRFHYCSDKCAAQAAFLRQQEYLLKHKKIIFKQDLMKRIKDVFYK